ncbi:unnamed protein product [Lactuca saligna]|uniref:Uncharacterized protein n=1 Tax=Lactuca saligna TaxID=75948 RepID=A0AA35ZMJ2_LACSI|nr:unnamed protein product [Lactuca saligna]
MEEDVVPKSPLRENEMAHSSPMRGSLIKLNLEAIVNPSGNVETSKVNTTINLGEQPNHSTPKMIDVITLEVSTVESILEEDDETDDGEFMGSFADIEFDPEEEGIPDHMLMFGKKFKILNRKLNSVLQLQADSRDTLNRMDKNNELRVKAQFESFNGALRALMDVEKEIHVLYVQDVKTIRENVNLKIQELRDDMAKEFTALDHNYSTLHNKVDIIAGVVTKAVNWYNSLVPKFDKKVEVDVTGFGDIAKLVGELKDLISTFGSSSSSVFTTELLTQKFSFLKSNIHK